MYSSAVSPEEARKDPYREPSDLYAMTQAIGIAIGCGLAHEDALTKVIGVTPNAALRFKLVRAVSTLERERASRHLSAAFNGIECFESLFLITRYAETLGLPVSEKIFMYASDFKQKHNLASGVLAGQIGLCDDIRLFTRAIAKRLKSTVPLQEILSMHAQHNTSGDFAATVGKIAEQVKQTGSLGYAIEKSPLFGRFYSSCIMQVEEMGNLAFGFEMLSKAWE